jgi:hypothetical protein
VQPRQHRSPRKHLYVVSSYNLHFFPKYFDPSLVECVKVELVGRLIVCYFNYFTLFKPIHLFIFVMLRMEPGPHMLGKRSLHELQPQP